MKMKKMKEYQKMKMKTKKLIIIMIIQKFVKKRKIMKIKKKII